MSLMASSGAGPLLHFLPLLSLQAKALIFLQTAFSWIPAVVGPKDALCLEEEAGET